MSFDSALFVSLGARATSPAVVCGWILGLGVLVASISCGGEISYEGPTSDWPSYGNDEGGQRYSVLDQITPDNVDDLEEAWIYHTGDVSQRPATAFQVTPLLVEEKLVFCTPFNRVIALDPETGEEVWVFDPQLDRTISYSNQYVCRGVTYWVDEAAGSGRCGSRIFTATADSRLIALDAGDGRPCESFGNAGEVDLRSGVGELAYPGEYHVTSPPVIARGRVVVGSAVGDNSRIDAPSGVVRAYDARDGTLSWAWDSLPPDLEHPPEPVSDEEGAYRHGTANVWSVMSVDDHLGLVYLPTGNTSPDYYGGLRNGSDYYSSSVVALRAETGEVAWHFQTVHHDLWDFDVPAQPTLFDLRYRERTIPALVQTTKMGFLFVLDRRNGESLYEVEERPVPASDVAGETTAPTQPFPVELPTVSRIELDPSEAFGIFPFDRNDCRERLTALRWDGIYTPPSLEGSLMFPGNAGGSNWGGVAVDPGRQLVVANAMNLAWSVKLIPRDEFRAAAEAEPGIEFGAQRGTPFGLRREMLVSSLGVPCTPPPWGTLTVVDLQSKSVRWQVPFGTTRDLLPIPLAIGRWGMPNLGGPLVTASGLVFIGAAMDNYLRAFDLDNGDELWKARLPAGPQATPMTYRVGEESRQFVIIAAGGHARADTTLGDALVAFALPGS